MNTPFENQLTALRPRRAPASWKAQLLAELPSPRHSDEVAWWHLFLIPRPARWAVAGLWLAILLLRGMTPSVERGHFQDVSIVDVHHHTNEIKLAAAGQWPICHQDEQGAHFEFKLYEIE